GRIVYYLDVESGEVVESRDGEKLAEPRYRRVPRRSAASDAADQREFVTTLEPSPLRDALRAARDPAEFRKALAQDRRIERAWYVFKNDRATAAIESWLRYALRLTTTSVTSSPSASAAPTCAMTDSSTIRAIAPASDPCIGFSFSA